MTDLTSRRMVKPCGPRSGLLLGLMALPMVWCVSARPETLPLIPKWGRFEQSFRSSRVYANAPRDATLTVVFTSPLGETNSVHGFWDGDKTWRVRFSPDQAGRWSWATSCSDPDNRGLLHRQGAFLCAAAAGTNRFRQHGPVRVARDHRHFEHADGTPFFWLADSAWDGARWSDPQDWEMYARIRNAQKFSAVQWSVAPGRDWTKQSAFAGRDQNVVNPGFFQRLDGKVDALNQAGLLSVIVPIWSFDSLPGTNTDDDAVALLRYLEARWGANDVAWLLKVDRTNSGEVTRWQQVGRAVYGEESHAPVLILSGREVFNQFRNENWVDGLGYLGKLREQSSADILWGTLASEWKREPSRPLVNIEAVRENLLLSDGTRAAADDVRCAAWTSLLGAAPAGVGYGAEGVAVWNSTIEPVKSNQPGRNLPVWQRSLFLPGAKQMVTIAKVFNSIEFWRLDPAPEAIAEQPGSLSPHRYVAAASTPAKSLQLVYVPEDRTVKLLLDALPGWPEVSWTNPRTGEKSPAVAVVEGGTCQFPTPDPGDWLLVIKAGK